MCKVLVAEDEILLGLDIIATLGQAGIQAIGPYPTVERKGIPFAFVTAYDRIPLPQELRRAPLLRKPYDEQKLVSVARALLGIAQA